MPIEYGRTLKGIIDTQNEPSLKKPSEAYKDYLIEAMLDQIGKFESRRDYKLEDFRNYLAKRYAI